MGESRRAPIAAGRGRPRAAVLLAAACLLLAGGGPPPAEPPETASELGDLWRDRDAFYLRVDGRVPREAGKAPGGSREMLVKLEAMTRGRPWPGRWTVVELELKTSAEQTVTVAYAGGSPALAAMPAGRWVPLRLLMPERPRDLVLRATGPAGLAVPLEFRRVRLVDDRWVLWDDGWRVSREAGVLTLRPSGGEPVVLPLGSTGQVRVTEVGRLRALLAGPGVGGAVYASGRVSEGGVGLPTGRDAGRISVELSDDLGRVDRQSEGDADGDGYNERRGAVMVRAAPNTRRMTLRVIAPAGGSKRPAIEVQGLPDGEATVLWEGRVVKAHDRVPAAGDPKATNVLIELPADIAGASTVEVSVGTPAK